jgi:hypothetical protein
VTAGWAGASPYQTMDGIRNFGVIAFGAAPR